MVNKSQYNLETLEAGVYAHDFIGMGGSTFSAESTLGKTFFNAEWTNDTPAGKFVHCLIDGLKAIPGAE
jgi:hypothetical protein